MLHQTFANFTIHQSESKQAIQSRAIELRTIESPRIQLLRPLAIRRLRIEARIAQRIFSATG